MLRSVEIVGDRPVGCAINGIAVNRRAGMEIAIWLWILAAPAIAFVALSGKKS
jgi:hypothetical protein